MDDDRRIKKDRRRTDRGGKEIAEETDPPLVEILARPCVLHRSESWQGPASLAASSPRNRMLLMEHLPECALSDNTNWPSWEVDCCICDRLRACEQRVLDAAREAVVALKPRLKVEKYKGGYDCCGCSTTYDLMKDALAAIDALREKP